MKQAFQEEMRRIEWEFEEEKIEVQALRDFGTLDIENYHLSLRKDDIIQLPLWLAEVLIDEGIVRYHRDQQVDLNRLLQISYDENKSSSLVELNTSMFIRRVKEEIRRLEQESGIMAVRKLTSMKGSFNKIMRARIKKIMTYAQSTDQESKNKRLFSAEEEWIYYRMRELFESWTDLLSD